ncbi:hypothetical protein FOZ60_009553 [Perkinsus olseni]|uniref:Uncharacterized protein n=1 Tax=Perkinsus olseni TaxID=32597 RepID=A0A7J6NI66_PEROL|nr:hypothetical protein FOZ60_009553 [Perkinsus olseni]
MMMEDASDVGHVGVVAGQVAVDGPEVVELRNAVDDLGELLADVESTGVDGTTDVTCGWVVLAEVAALAVLELAGTPAVDSPTPLLLLRGGVVDATAAVEDAGD